MRVRVHQNTSSLVLNVAPLFKTLIDRRRVIPLSYNLKLRRNFTRASILRRVPRIQFTTTPTQTLTNRLFGTAKMPYKKGPMMDYVPSGPYVGKMIRSNTNTDLSDLCIRHIKAHLKSGKLYDEQLASMLTSSRVDGVPALTTIAINSMINSLRQDPSPSNFETVIAHAPETLLNSIIDSPKLHYTSMLRFMEQKGWDKLKDDSRRDLWILKNELFIRADGTDWGLLTLEDADIIFAHSSKIETNAAGEPSHRLITRKIGPKGGLQYLDQRRPRTLKIQPSIDAYKKAFDRLMNGALDGLDWSNIIVAGGMALSALLAVDDTLDKQYKDNDIDMYIYGLTPEKANEKVKHIANVWKKNLPEGEDYMMIKNAKTITLLGKYPNRRIQIILKMVKNPAAVLVNFDLDQVAIAYTGESVLMLPRCARALETGYTIFTLEMIHGHHLNGRRETQEERLFKYAKRGFGIRILPEFCDLVEIDFNARRHIVPFVDQSLGHVRRNRWSNTITEIDDENDQEEGGYYRRKRPTGTDIKKGVNAVRRVFAAGEDMVYRFYLGRTETTAPEDYDDDESMLSEDEGPYGNSDYYMFDYEDPDTGEKKKLPKGLFSALDTYRAGVGTPHGKRGLGSMELHARHCALFRFETEKKMIVDYGSLTSLTYDIDSYDMLPQYKWDADFKPEDFMEQITGYNDTLFDRLCDIMDHNETFANSGGVQKRNLRGGYLTRRIRRLSVSKNINELVDQFQVVVPVLIPLKLEEWIKEQYAQALEDAGISSADHQILIPVHEPGKGTLPDLAESTEENVRFWLLDSTTIWAGLDRRIDEIHEILWVIVTASSLVIDYNFGYSTREEAARDWFEIIASFLLRRVAKLSSQQIGVVGGDGALEDIQEGVENVDIEPFDPLAIPTERDRYLLTKWLMERPVEIYRSYQYEVRSNYRESNNLIAPPEVMYWRDDLDGSTEWREWPEDSSEPGFEPITTFRPQPKPKRPSQGSDAEGEAAPEDDDNDDAAAAENENGDDAPEEEDAPRGVKRPREESDLQEMMRGGGDGDNDTSMADAPGSSR